MASWIVHYDFHPQRYHQAQVSNHKLQYTRFSQFHILLKIYDEFHEIQSKPEDVRDNMVVWQSCSSSLSSSLLTLGNPQPLIASISLTCWWQFCEDRVWSFSTTVQPCGWIFEALDLPPQLHIWNWLTCIPIKCDVVPWPGETIRATSLSSKEGCLVVYSLMFRVMAEVFTNTGLWLLPSKASSDSYFQSKVATDIPLS